MTIVDTILARAEAYPDRAAIVSADGTTILYRDLASALPNVTQYEHSTSGTTDPRHPKRIIVTDDNLQRRVARLEALRPALASVQKLLVPISDRHSLFVQLRSYILLNGKTLFVTGEATTAAVIAMCNDNAVDGLTFVPKHPLSDELLALRPNQTPNFAHIFVSGGTASPQVFDRIATSFGGAIHVNYAASEVGQVAGADYSEISAIPGCVGRVAPDVTVEIVNGNIRIQCDTMVSGYVDDARMTKARFYNGFFYPGDKGYFDGEFLVINGRV